MIVKQRTFYSGRDSNGIPTVLSEELFEPYNMGKTKFLELSNKFYSPVSYYNVNPHRIITQLQTILHNLNLEIKEVFSIDYQIGMSIQNSPIHAIPMDLMSLCKMRQEYIINNFKRIIDELIILFCIKHDLSNISITDKIKVLSIGDLIKNKNSDLKNKIKIELLYNKFECIFKAINDLHNAFKHDILMNEARGMMGLNVLTTTGVYAPYGNIKFDNITILNHSFSQIIIGFNDFICDISEYIKFTGNHTYNQYNVTL
jgi:hypothetical protein